MHKYFEHSVIRKFLKKIYEQPRQSDGSQPVSRGFKSHQYTLLKVGRSWIQIAVIYYCVCQGLWPS